MEIEKIGVVGAGIMGSGIAQLAAQIGCHVVMSDIETRFVDGGMKKIGAFLAKSVEKGKMDTKEKDAIIGRIRGTINMGDLRDVDFVVEAVSEDLGLKKRVFKELDELCRPEPDKVCGMHFFNPAPLMRLVEVIRGYSTSDETINTASELAQKMGKVTVEVKKDSPGFIVNRIMIPHFLEAIKIVEQGIASIEDVDKAVKNGLNYPMGPFELMDLTGIDIAYLVSEYLYNELNKENKWVAPNLLKTMVRAGKLGKKTGEGWYK